MASRNPLAFVLDETSPLLSPSERRNNDNHTEASGSRVFTAELSQKDLSIVKQSEQKFADGFGGKTIGGLGGFCLLLNNVTGPGMVNLALMYQQSGWFVPTVLMLVVAGCSSLSSTMLSEAMTHLPGNDVFQSRAEMITLAKYLFGNGVFYYGTVALFVLSLTSINVAAIIISSQTMDITIIKIKETCALEFFPKFGFLCTDKSVQQGDSPFGDNSYVFSLGFLVILVMSIPLGYFNLNDNIIVQKIACLMLVFIVAVWMTFFIHHGLVESLPAFGTNYAQVVGVIFFNYTFVTSIPSWVNEKQTDVSIQKSIWGSTLVGTIFFLLIGIFGALGLQIAANQDILAAINAVDNGGWILQTAKITVLMFPITALVSSIPIFSIIIRYNLLHNKICNKHIANLIAIVLPWVISLPFYTGRGLINVTNWSSLLFNGIINFVVPILFYIMALDKSREAPRTLRYIAYLESRVDDERKERRAKRHAAAAAAVVSKQSKKRGGVVATETRAVSVNNNDSTPIVHVKKTDSSVNASAGEHNNTNNNDDDDDDDDDEHEPTACEVQLSIIRATLNERRRLLSLARVNAAHAAAAAAVGATTAATVHGAALPIPTNGARLNPDDDQSHIDELPLLTENISADEGSLEGSLIYKSLPAESNVKQHFVAWPFKYGRAFAIFMIVFLMVLNIIAVVIAFMPSSDATPSTTSTIATTMPVSTTSALFDSH